MEMYVEGVSTRKVAEVTKSCAAPPSSVFTAHGSVVQGRTSGLWPGAAWRGPAELISIIHRQPLSGVPWVQVVSEKELIAGKVCREDLDASGQ
jgi:hypothetical protein